MKTGALSNNIEYVQFESLDELDKFIDDSFTDILKDEGERAQVALTILSRIEALDKRFDKLEALFNDKFK